VLVNPAIRSSRVSQFGHAPLQPVDSERGPLMDAGTTTTPPGGLLEACESQFERDVLQKIMARGDRKLSVQHIVGRYGIDIVVEGPHARLAVECDGDRWGGPDAWHKDRARQQVLEQAGCSRRPATAGVTPGRVCATVG
jgi:hypothetical protein